MLSRNGIISFARCIYIIVLIILSIESLVLYLKTGGVIFCVNTDQMACFIYTLCRITWSIKSIILCYYSVCVLLVDNHLCDWNSCDVMLCGNNIRNLFMIVCIAVNIILTGNEGRKEGTCLFDINNHNTEYTTVKLCRETPTKAQSVPLSREPPTCHNT